jgi:hypothetical protein
MQITFGPSCFMSEKTYMADFKPGKTDTYNFTPEQVFSKYNV